MDLYRGLTPAVLSYEGIAFQYMAPAVFEDRQLAYVQKHLRILSAFYGVLEPMDGVTPYRLEMQAKVGIGDAKNLYDYWGERLYRSVIDDSRVIINLASKEYSKCIEKYWFQNTIKRRQDSQVLLYICKLSILKHSWCHILKCDSLRKFDSLGYTFRRDLSSESEYVFERK